MTRIGCQALQTGKQFIADSNRDGRGVRCRSCMDVSSDVLRLSALSPSASHVSVGIHAGCACWETGYGNMAVLDMLSTFLDWCDATAGVRIGPR